MQAIIVSAGNNLVFVLYRLKTSAIPGLPLDVPVVDEIHLRAGLVVSLQMFHSDAVAVRDFLYAAAASPR